VVTSVLTRAPDQKVLQDFDSASGIFVK
jgi:hypothetical protein